jgi:hypothetical protein
MTSPMRISARVSDSFEHVGERFAAFGDGSLSL